VAPACPHPRHRRRVTTPPRLNSYIRLTLPLLGPQLFFCLVLGVIDSFQVFAQVDLMTAGGPLNSTNVLVYDLYQQGFSYFHVGYACAMATVLMLGLGAVTFAQQRWIGAKMFYR
jgi:ABC-type sugar transport system permease subunit